MTTLTMMNFNADKGVFRLKDKWSAITHLIGFFASLIGMPILLVKAGVAGASLAALCGYAIFTFSLIVLYGASSSYHSFNISYEGNMVLKRIDHSSIFVLIAGTYTPLCLTILQGHGGTALLIVIWSIAFLGILFKIRFVTCPKIVSSILYIAMGWACVVVLPTLWNSLGKAFWLLLAGGLFYTVGGVIYSFKPKIFKNEEKTGFGNHEFFHCFVLAGSLCHYLMMLAII